MQLVLGWLIGVVCGAALALWVGSIAAHPKRVDPEE